MLAYIFDSSTQEAKAGGAMKASQGYTVRLSQKTKAANNKKVVLPRNSGLLISKRLRQKENHVQRQLGLQYETDLKK